MKAILNDGYYKVANTLALALCKVSLNDREHRVVQAVMLKTYGFNKPMDWICNGQLAELTDIDVNNIGKVKNGLIKRNILVKEGRELGVNTDVEQWDFDGKRYTRAAIQQSKSTENTVEKDCEYSLNGLGNQSKRTASTVLLDCNFSASQHTEPVDLDWADSLNRLETQSKTTPTKENTITKDKKICLPSRSKKNSVPIKKPEPFKKFFAAYPAHRKGGTDQTCWKAWKDEKLTEQDALAALTWLQATATANPAWRVDSHNQYVLGITKFIRERTWLTPIPIPDPIASSANDFDWDVSIFDEPPTSQPNDFIEGELQ